MSMVSTGFKVTHAYTQSESFFQCIKGSAHGHDLVQIVDGIAREAAAMTFPEFCVVRAESPEIGPGPVAEGIEGIMIVRGR
jgi:hypothetical protein